MKFVLKRNTIFLLSLLAVLGLFQVGKFHFLFNSAITDGQIVDIVESRSAPSKFGFVSTYHHPVVRYMVSGKTFTFTSYPDIERLFYYGENVKVIYKKNYSDARIYSFAGFWFPFSHVTWIIVFSIVAAAAVYSFIDPKKPFVLKLWHRVDKDSNHV